MFTADLPKSTVNGICHHKQKKVKVSEPINVRLPNMKYVCNIYVSSKDVYFQSDAL